MGSVARGPFNSAVPRWRPLVQHPRPLAYGQLDARPGPDDLLEHATRLVEVLARRRNKLASRSRVIVCWGSHSSELTCPNVYSVRR